VRAGGRESQALQSAAQKAFLDQSFQSESDCFKEKVACLFVDAVFYIGILLIMPLPTVYFCGLVLLLVLQPLCSATRHEMFNAAHPLLSYPHAHHISSSHSRQYHDDEARQWICGVQEASCDRVVQSCSGSGCALVDVLQPHACIVYMTAVAERDLL
jgi:hypothetical protein